MKQRNPMMKNDEYVSHFLDELKNRELLDSWSRRWITKFLSENLSEAYEELNRFRREFLQWGSVTCVGVGEDWCGKTKEPYFDYCIQCLNDFFKDGMKMDGTKNAKT